MKKIEYYLPKEAFLLLDERIYGRIAFEEEFTLSEFTKNILERIQTPDIQYSIDFEEKSNNGQVMFKFTFTIEDEKASFIYYPYQAMGLFDNGGKSTITLPATDLMFYILKEKFYHEIH